MTAARAEHESLRREGETLRAEVAIVKEALGRGREHTQRLRAQLEGARGAQPTPDVQHQARAMRLEDDLSRATLDLQVQ